MLFEIKDTHEAIKQVEAKVGKIKRVMGSFNSFNNQNMNLEVSTNNLVVKDTNPLDKDMDDFPSGGIPFGGGEKIPCVMRGQLGDGVSGCLSARGFNQTALGNLNIDSLNQFGSDLTDLGDSISGQEELSKENFLKND